MSASITRPETFTGVSFTEFGTSARSRPATISIVAPGEKAMPGEIASTDFAAEGCLPSPRRSRLRSEEAGARAGAARGKLRETSPWRPRVLRLAGLRMGGPITLIVLEIQALRLKRLIAEAKQIATDQGHPEPGPPYVGYRSGSRAGLCACTRSCRSSLASPCISFTW